MGQEKIYYCVGCGKVHNKNNFYVSYSQNHANGRLFYCKDFIKKKIYKDNNVIDVDKLKSILRQLDLPFLENVFETAVECGGDTVGHYFRLLNSLPQNKGLSWKDSTSQKQINIDTENINNEDNYNDNNIKDLNDMSEKDISELEDKWGFGYSPEELYLFEKKYLMLKDNYNEKTAMHTEALYNYIRYRVKEEIATAEIGRAHV